MPEFSSSVKRIRAEDARYSILDAGYSMLPPGGPDKQGSPLRFDFRSAPRCSILDACACRFGTLGLGRKSSEEKSEYVEPAQLTCVTASMGKPILRRTEARNLPYFVPHSRLGGPGS